LRKAVELAAASLLARFAVLESVRTECQRTGSHSAAENIHVSGQCDLVGCGDVAQRLPTFTTSPIGLCLRRVAVPDVDGWSTPAVHADPEFGRAKSISDHASLEAIETEALHRRNIGELCRQHPAVERLLAEALALRVTEAPRRL
jgi:hypothetical protein